MISQLLQPEESKSQQRQDPFTRALTPYNGRATAQPFLINYIDSGMVGEMAYGTRVRAVQMTRGNRQGNNAFLQDNFV